MIYYKFRNTIPLTIIQQTFSYRTDMGRHILKSPVSPPGTTMAGRKASCH
jgi:hypothetical protein